MLGGTFWRVWAVRALCAVTAVAVMHGGVLRQSAVAWAGETTGWRTQRPIKAVVLGGSISMYYAGNFGQFLHYGCRDLEVINRGQVGAGARKILGNLREQVVAEKGFSVLPGKGWVIVQGGLNSVWAPQSTSWWLSRIFVEAHDAGFQVAALSLSPWGSDDDPRFDGWKGLRLHVATEHVVDFVLGRLKPAEALGRRAGQRTGASDTWESNELPDLAVDLWRSPLKAGNAAKLREAGPLDASYGSGPGAHHPDERKAWIDRARATPRQYLAKTYHDFDHIHPNTAGHRLIAALLCQQAPKEWRCDCDAIRHAQWKGKVVPAVNTENRETKP